ncbi:NAD(P)/FAD-dependent oxidoreductase [bacterium]|nr:NAD(P)/FAD-dependent oxidoreductase [bacterium]
MLKDGEKGAILQRDHETYAIAPHLPCGVVTPDQLRTLADVAEKFNVAALKITSAARIAMVGIQEDEVDAVWDALGMSAGAAVGLCIRSVKACPGTTFCKRGKQDSLAMGMTLDEKYHGYKLPGKLKLGVSGCGNQCAETCIKDIGLMGKGAGWTVMVGGNGGALPRLAVPIAKDLSDADALALVDRIVAFFAENGKPHERMGRMIQRIGLETLASAVLPA